MKIIRAAFLILLLVLVASISSSYVYASAICLEDVTNPTFINKPNPTIIVDFKDDIDYEKLSLHFVMYPLDEVTLDWDFVDPIEIDILEELSFENGSVLTYNLTEELQNKMYYSLEVSAPTLNPDDEDSFITLYECELFFVDYGPIEISKVKPESNYVSESSYEMVFETTRRSECHISTRTDRIGSMERMSSTGGFIHRNIHPGSSPFYVGCVDDPDQTVEEFDIILDTTPPTTPEIEVIGLVSGHPNISTSRNSVRVKFSSSDQVSGIKNINFSIIEKSTGRNMMPWTTLESVDEWLVITRDGLGNSIQLADKGIYEIEARARNNAGLLSQESRSQPFQVYVGFDPDDIEVDLCEDRDVECDEGHPCTADVNCASGFCHPEENVCAIPTCNDGFINQDETDVDCGGSCPGCDVGQKCSTDNDCLSDNCDLLTQTCDIKDEPESPPPPVERPPQPPPQDERNIIFPILLVVGVLGVVGGGGYYVFSNKDQLFSYINSSGLGVSKKDSSPSVPIQQQIPNPQNNQSSTIATQLSRRLRSKEGRRKREDMFKGFSNQEGNEKTKLSKDDIDSLFDTKK